MIWVVNYSIYHYIRSLCGWPLKKYISLMCVIFVHDRKINELFSQVQSDKMYIGSLPTELNNTYVLHKTQHMEMWYSQLHRCHRSGVLLKILNISRPPFFHYVLYYCRGSRILGARSTCAHVQVHASYNNTRYMYNTIYWHCV